MAAQVGAEAAADLVESQVIVKQPFNRHGVDCMIPQEVKALFGNRQLCWLATADATGVPNRGHL
jgi:predicted pyridoxine 5'-phosphate oxidase superfamily flavin-nucleotide-binding protein